MSAAVSSTNGQQRIRKARVPLSCDPCRSRKLKCNREKPCQNCLVRQEPTKCHYKNSNPVPSASRHVNRDAMQERLNRLESLVTDLVSQTSGPDVQPAPNGAISVASSFPGDGEANQANGIDKNPLDDLHNGIGQMNVGTKQTFYRGASHWGDVLQEVNELKNAWSQVQDEEEESHTQVSILETEVVDGPSLLSGLVQPVDIAELLDTVPPKPAVDKMIAKFFDDEDRIVPVLHILHEPTFMKEYAQHWANPGGTNLMWLGLLFAIMNLTMLGYHSFDKEPPEYEGMAESLAEVYRIRTAQCLMMADITKCAPHTIETLVYNCLAESSRRNGNEKGVWMMVGVLTRSAIQMGYHRDSAMYPELSVFQGEMRRRVWSFIMEMDSLTSFVVGLPSMIKSFDSDTAEPLNVHDWELSENMLELPQSRPLEQITPVGYLVCKSRLLRAVGGVVDFINSLQIDTYDNTVVTLDDSLSKARLAMPAYLTMPTLNEAVKDTTAICSGRIKLEFYYHQGVCVLHRKFLASGRTNDQHALSYKRCLESSKALLSIQQFLYEEASIRGSFRAPKWYRISFASPDFILATTIAFLELQYRKEKHTSSSVSSWIMDDEELGLLQALKNVCLVWDRAREFSRDATKFHRVLIRMLNSLDTSSNSELLHDPKQSNFFSQTPSSMIDTTISTDSSDGVGLLDTNMNIDWAAWDAFVEGSSINNGYMSTPFNEWDLIPNI